MSARELPAHIAHECKRSIRGTGLTKQSRDRDYIPKVDPSFLIPQAGLVTMSDLSAKWIVGTKRVYGDLLAEIRPGGSSMECVQQSRRQTMAQSTRIRKACEDLLSEG